ncbi:hypothetical protein EJB05_56238 [Eragrostis curvula]|uniref:KIB1-4 beta-propeller domain-containing protein n=1 Tax=Eragrostis curvula TaxID=38414 RepID=A0A5J9SI07_9POAL|nr:hypothetical protein EJB05_56238 [Eragrostis curvula]
MAAVSGDSRRNHAAGTPRSQHILVDVWHVDMHPILDFNEMEILDWTDLEVAVAERLSKKTCHAASSTSTITPGPDVWADLLDSLLHQIVALLNSFQDLLAFIGTCRSWRAALSSLPPAFSFNFPPLHLQTDMNYPHPRRNYIKYSHLSHLKWKLTDPAKQTSSLCCSPSQNLRDRMCYLGCSFGYLIFSSLEQCVLVDVYSSAVVRPPKFKSTGNHELYYGILVASLNSPNSQLLLCSRTSMFQWQVGTDSWLEHPFCGERILQIVFFRGEIFAMDFLERLHRIRLVPQLIVQEVAVVWGEDMVVGLNFKPWLVVCSDMLLLVDLSVDIDALSGFSGTFKVFRLDFSVEPAKWVKVENLGNSALFVSLDRRNPTFSSMNPERWGGKSNCVYVAGAGSSEDSNEAWTVVELGQEVPSTALCSTYSPMPIQTPSGHGNHPQNMWVLPSFVYGVEQ